MTGCGRCAVRALERLTASEQDRALGACHSASASVSQRPRASHSTTRTRARPGREHRARPCPQPPRCPQGYPHLWTTSSTTVESRSHISPAGVAATPSAEGGAAGFSTGVFHRRCPQGLSTAPGRAPCPPVLPVLPVLRVLRVLPAPCSRLPAPQRLRVDGSIPAPRIDELTGRTRVALTCRLGRC